MTTGVLDVDGSRVSVNANEALLISITNGGNGIGLEPASHGAAAGTESKTLVLRVKVLLDHGCVGLDKPTESEREAWSAGVWVSATSGTSVSITSVGYLWGDARNNCLLTSLSNIFLAQYSCDLLLIRSTV